jgi:hypothetical protein
MILGRVAVRSGVAIWRQRFAVIGAGCVVAAFSVYEFTFAGPTVSNGDCADTAMTAVTRVDDTSARAAYACLGPAMRTTSEDQFVSNMLSHNASSGAFDRIADKRTSDGGRIVFFTVHADKTPVVGYIVYLDAQGKIIKIE